MDRREALDRSIVFLREIGFEVIEQPVTAGFLEHVRIHEGKLQVNVEQASAANLLHEAGHVAVAPSWLRPQISDDLDQAFEKLGPALDEAMTKHHPDHPEIRAMLQCGETEATAWAWAAGKAIGLPDEQIIENQDYDGGGEVIRIQLSHNSYFGINGMVHGGMVQNVRSYPSMTRWLQI